MKSIRTIKAKSGTNLEGASAHNRRVIVDALRVNGELSRAELARATALTKQTVSNIVVELERDGLVASLAPVRQARGQPSTPYRLVPEGGFAIGVQLDRHVIRCIAVDLLGSVLIKAEKPLPTTDLEDGVLTLLALIDKTRKALIKSIPAAAERIVGLGVAMPGPFGAKTDQPDPWMMSDWQNYPLQERLTSATGLDVQLQNDATAAAIAEKMIGAAHGLDHAICVYFGYGLGAGIILNGELYRGGHGNAGEIGMILSQANRNGGALPVPVEHRASIASLCHAMDLDLAEPDLYHLIEQAVAQAHPSLNDWVDSAALELRFVVQLLEAVFDPQTIILCGGLPESLAKLLLQRVQPLLPSYSERIERHQPRLQLGFTDPFAVAIGAASEPISRTFDPRFSAILKTLDASQS